MKPYTININGDGYGETTEENIEIVQLRERYIAEQLGMDVEEEHRMLRTGLEEIDYDHADICEKIWELAMECNSITDRTDPSLAHAARSAMEKYPLQ